MSNIDFSGVDLLPEGETFQALDAYIWARDDLDQLYVNLRASNDGSAGTIAVAVGAWKTGDLAEGVLVTALMDLYKRAARSEQSSE